MTVDAELKEYAESLGWKTLDRSKEEPLAENKTYFFINKKWDLWECIHENALVWQCAEWGANGFYQNHEFHTELKTALDSHWKNNQCTGNIN